MHAQVERDMYKFKKKQLKIPWETCPGFWSSWAVFIFLSAEWKSWANWSFQRNCGREWSDQKHEMEITGGNRWDQGKIHWSGTNGISY